MALHLNHKIISMLLQISVVGLGFGINFESALKAGNDGFVKSVGWPALQRILTWSAISIGTLFMS